MACLGCLKPSDMAAIQKNQPRTQGDVDYCVMFLAMNKTGCYAQFNSKVNI